VDKEYGDVHTSHCCKWHGCKYDNADCTVEFGDNNQLGPCEWCSDEFKEYINREQPDRDWLSYMRRWVDDGGRI